MNSPEKGMSASNWIALGGLIIAALTCYFSYCNDRKNTNPDTETSRSNKLIIGKWKVLIRDGEITLTGVSEYNSQGKNLFIGSMESETGKKLKCAFTFSGDYEVKNNKVSYHITNSSVDCDGQQALSESLQKRLIDDISSQEIVQIGEKAMIIKFGSKEVTYFRISND